MKSNCFSLHNCLESVETRFIFSISSFIFFCIFLFACFVKASLVSLNLHNFNVKVDMKLHLTCFLNVLILIWYIMSIYVYVSFGAFKSCWKVRIYTLGLHNYVIRYVQIPLVEERCTCNLINIKCNNMF